jgi:MFS family permease
MSANPSLGLRENLPQFSLLVAVTLFVGAMVGLERSTLPLIGREDFGVESSAAVLSFLVAFGAAKALANLVAGGLAQRAGRRRLLIWGWLLALPVPLLIAVAPSWPFVVIANLFLGVSQGLTWSMTIVMKVDLVGPRRRGLALGLNESAGYAGVGLAAALTGLLAADLAARDVLVASGFAVAGAGLLVSLVFVRDTGAHATFEHRQLDATGEPGAPTAVGGLRSAFARGTFGDPGLRACSQAGLVNNLNDALAWGLVPLFMASRGASVEEVGLVAGIYPAVWGLTQIPTGAWSDKVGRKPLIVAGMLVQAAALALLALSDAELRAAVTAAVVLGVGTALVYPTLLAAVSDRVSPLARPGAVGVYRFWRDAGYVAGALIAGVAADALGDAEAIGIVAALTALSGLWVLAELSGDPGR